MQGSHAGYSPRTPVCIGGPLRSESIGKMYKSNKASPTCREFGVEL